MDVERCGLKSGEMYCVLAKGHEENHCFRNVPVFPESDMFVGGPSYSSFCPYCGSDVMMEGPGCRRCDPDSNSDPDSDSDS